MKESPTNAINADVGKRAPLLPAGYGRREAAKRL